MNTDKYRRSKLPVSLVLLFLLNLLVVIALEILLLYPAPFPVTPEALAEFDSRYAGCTITQEAEQGGLYCCLAETADGEIHMIPARSHGLAYNRAKLLKKYITVIPEGQETTIPIRIGVHTSNVTVSAEPLSSIAIDYYGSTNICTAATLYMVIAAVLEGLELALFHLLRRED